MTRHSLGRRKEARQTDRRRGGIVAPAPRNCSPSKRDPRDQEWKGRHNPHPADGPASRVGRGREELKRGGREPGHPAGPWRGGRAAGPLRRPRRQICCLIPAPSRPAAPLTMLSAMVAAPVSRLEPRAAAACRPAGLAAPTPASAPAPASGRRRHRRSSFTARPPPPRRPVPRPTRSPGRATAQPGSGRATRFRPRDQVPAAQPGSGPTNGPRLRRAAPHRAPRGGAPRGGAPPAGHAVERSCREAGREALTRVSPRRAVGGLELDIPSASLVPWKWRNSFGKVISYLHDMYFLRRHFP